MSRDTALKFTFKELGMFKRFLTFLVAVIVIAAFSFPLLSEESAEKDKEPMFIEVVEVLGNVPVVKTIQSVTIFKNEEMEKFNFDSLKSLLSLTPGLLTLSSGQFGQTSSTYIRGSKNTQVLYIVDGVKLRDGASIGGVNLAVLSPNLIGRLEVVRGPLSHIYGSDAMGGVVSMNTHSKEGAQFMASTGSHGSYTGNFNGTVKLKDFTLGLAVNSQRYSDNVDNDVFKNNGLSAKMGYKNETIETGLRFFGSFTDSGIPLVDGGVATPDRHYKQDYYILSVPFHYNFDENSKVAVNLAYTNSKYTFEDPNDMWSPYFLTRFDNYEAEVNYNGRFFEKLDIRAGLDYSDQKILNENNYGKTLDDEKMSYFSGFAAAAVNLEALQLSASVRYDKYKNVDANFSPQIGISYLVANKLKLRASYSQSFLAPMVSQIVNPWGDANFDLKPEKGKSFEVGAEFYSEKVTLSATYFNTKYQDMIDWVTTDWFTYVGQYRNITNVDSYGMELAATLQPVYNLKISGAYTYLHTEDKATGEPLVRKPKHTFSGFLAYAHKRFTVSVSMVYVGKRADLDFSLWPANVESPSFNTYDISLVVPVYKGLSIFGKMTNAFDKEYQELVGYPSPGRRFEVGLKYRVK
ncbi:MAG: TonB-dependent receptor [bacterium]|nr:TonB-dependent receptor [bacterium]